MPNAIGLSVQILPAAIKALREKRFNLFFCILKAVMTKNELKLFWHAPENKIANALKHMPYPVIELAKSYPILAKYIREDCCNKTRTPKEIMGSVELGALSLLYIALYIPDLKGFTTIYPYIDPDFVFNNRKHLFFWQHFLSHIPHVDRLEAFHTIYDTDRNSILPYILKSSPKAADLIHEFLAEIQLSDPTFFPHIKISEDTINKYRNLLNED